MSPPSETVVQVPSFGERTLVDRRLHRLTVNVPYDGEQVIFQLRADRASFNPPRVFALNDSQLTIVVDGPAPDGEAIRANIDGQLDKIEEHLSWSRLQIDERNRQLQHEVPGLVARRREELLRVRSLQAAIGFPIRTRADANTYAAPLRRSKLRPSRSTSSSVASFRPEPAMDERDYQAALTVLRHARTQLERTPPLAAKLGEEEIRNLLLIALNTHFEGDAAGEVFNGNGKTDILIRVEDRNIFIGECKIWDGIRAVDDALAQVMGYLVWRDTKAAILLFIRTRNATAVISKAVERIEQHPCYKRRGPRAHDEQIDFVLHAQDDPQREIRLALLPFALRADPAS